MAEKKEKVRIEIWVTNDEEKTILEMAENENRNRKTQCEHIVKQEIKRYNNNKLSKP